MTQPKEYYCTACDGTDITVEAHCYWDNVEQKFAHFEIEYEDDHWCSDCEDRVEGRFRPIADVKTLAQVAIVKTERKTA